jgi:hypothetical protein
MEPEILLHKYQPNRKTIGSLIHFIFDCKTTAYKFNTMALQSDFLSETTFGIGLKALYFLKSKHANIGVFLEKQFCKG